MKATITAAVLALSCTLAKVKKLRAEGEQLHKAGKHSESMATLARAKKLLGI